MLSVGGLNQKSLLQLLKKGILTRNKQHIRFALNELLYISESMDDAWNVFVLFCLQYVFHNIEFSGHVELLKKVVIHHEWFMNSSEVNEDIEKRNILLEHCWKVLDLDYVNVFQITSPFQLTNCDIESIENMWCDLMDKDYVSEFQELHEYIRYEKERKNLMMHVLHVAYRAV